MTEDDGSQIVFVTKSETGRYFCIRIDEQGRTFYGSGASETVLNGDFSACAGRDFTFLVA